MSTDDVNVGIDQARHKLIAAIARNFPECIPGYSDVIRRGDVVVRYVSEYGLYCLEINRDGIVRRYDVWLRRNYVYGRTVGSATTHYEDLSAGDIDELIVCIKAVADLAAEQIMETR